MFLDEDVSVFVEYVPVFVIVWNCVCFVPVLFVFGKTYVHIGRLKVFNWKLFLISCVGMCVSCGWVGHVGGWVGGWWEG